jgi:hypothetical protein
MYKVSTYNSSGDACLAPVAIPVADKIAFDNNNFERTKVHNSILTCASNPFINIANIVLDISMSAYGQIEVFDLVGRQLMIQNFERNEAGKFSINFDGSQYPAQTFVCRAKIHFADGVYQEKEISILEIK